MAEERNTIFKAVVGTMGCGKSTVLSRYADKYKERYPSRDILVLDPHFTFRSRHAMNICSKTNYNPNTVLDELLTVQNSLIILDDIRSVTTKNGQAITNLGINGRHAGNDIIVVYHSLQQVQSSVKSVCADWWLFKVIDNYHAVYNRIPHAITKDIVLRASRLETFHFIEVKI